MLAREVLVFGGLAAQNREELRGVRADGLERLGCDVDVRDDELARLRVHHWKRDAAELHGSVLHVVEELVANTTDLFASRVRLCARSIAAVLLEDEHALAAGEVILVRVRV